ncbi:MAG TPA: 16S rRNA (guanine(966)-N(2))-methyltransferase RsmD [Bacillota bacterium]|jgi:16S rRNA (guanine(966)-N(2))-methyltransferase RsmD|nr:16S rRNA (guanine(966)-N(2))-methyltransferase RsmD [Bacillota bacterium]HOB87732.1 16S rRNA (guanine(966)-N(2))-methyltransferase RsmD [Bacillota bacterium]HOP69333.1 16S rRNA (guanine(966)-N(2))-methyltransferase RsmD [Bacillota bacterium]HPT34715.1 16S rRNA (guanine(966)-N(2))-methyltransferase RsmD [Bacillota bacterium]HQD06194.1 16S rRNA (guanine(966)-N(2))-methyltransferase RsmD [Bacillota bacterium]
MRVVAGTAKGTLLKTAPGTRVRPTSAKVKEALFSILGDRVPEALFWDLFAGSGAVGIEALSRGAESAVFVERQGRMVGIIKDNLKRSGLLEGARIIRADVERALDLLAGEGLKADLIFMDPPYDYPRLPLLIEKIENNNLLCPGGLIIIESSSKNTQQFAGFRIKMQKKYGDTMLTIIA